MRASQTPSRLKSRALKTVSQLRGLAACANKYRQNYILDSTPLFYELLRVIRCISFKILTGHLIKAEGLGRLLGKFFSLKIFTQDASTIPLFGEISRLSFTSSKMQVKT